MSSTNTQNGTNTANEKEKNAAVQTPAAAGEQKNPQQNENAGKDGSKPGSMKTPSPAGKDGKKEGSEEDENEVDETSVEEGGDTPSVPGEANSGATPGSL